MGDYQPAGLDLQIPSEAFERSAEMFLRAEPGFHAVEIVPTLSRPVGRVIKISMSGPGDATST